MGLIQGSLGFRRYRMWKKLPDDFRDTFTEQINRFAFRENLGHRSKEPMLGWVNIFNPDDTHFDLNTFLYDRYLVLGMRMDKKTVNGKLFQILLQRRMNEVMAERNVDRLGKNHKEEIQEALEEDLLGKALPSVNTYDLAWDIHTGEVLLFATSDTVLDQLQGLTHDTFDALIYSERMVDWLAEKWDWSAIEARVDACIPGGASEKGLELSADGWHEGNPLKGREMLMGTEFLTWLWYGSEERDGYFRLEDPELTGAPGDGQKEDATRASLEGEGDGNDDGLELAEADRPPEPSSDDELKRGSQAAAAQTGVDEIVLWMDTKLTLQDIEDVAVPSVTTMVGEAPAASPEAKATMVAGKRPIEARVGIQRGDHEWFVTLKVGPAGLEMRSLKLPIEVKQGEEEKIYERMYLLEFLTSTLKTLFRQFFVVRTSDDWPGLIEKWLERESQAR